MCQSQAFRDHEEFGPYLVLCGSGLLFGMGDVLWPRVWGTQVTYRGGE